jgi:hypothetical protein
MLPTVTILAMLLGTLAVLATPGRVAAQTHLIAELSGAEEVPGPGDPDGFAFVSLQLDPDAGEVCGHGEVGDIAEATASHIHEGAAGIAGPPVVTLPTPADGFFEGCVAADGALLQTIIDDPAGYYVNIHTAEYPDGAVRGQLRVPPDYLVAELSGTREVPGPGDPDGVGFADVTVDVPAGQLCANILVEGIAAATAAHIHSGAVGVAGPVVVTLPTPDATGQAEGCVDGLDPVMLQAIVDGPTAYYVNVHNAEYPDGAVRGQLSNPELVREVFATLTGDAEVPGPGDPDGAGEAFLLLRPDLGQVCGFLQVTDIAAATAAHIHAGEAGVAGDVVVTLLTPNAEGISDGCVDGVDPALLDAIIASPESYYVNVHTADYPAGALRGQLSFEPPPPAPCAPGEPCEGELSPGTYTYRGFGTDLTFTTVTPWFFVPDEIPSFVLFDFESTGGLYAFPFVGDVFADPCDMDSASTIGDSPEEFLEWLADRSFLETTDPVPVTYGGASGYQLDLLSVSVPAECTEHPWALVIVLPIYGDFHFENGSTGRVVALDVAGETILFIAEHVDFGETEGEGGESGDPAAFLGRAQGVLDSMVWALGGGPVAPPASPSASPSSLPDTATDADPEGRTAGSPLGVVLGGLVVVGTIGWLLGARPRAAVRHRRP